MQTIDILLNLIKESEGCKLKAYKCPAGKWTVGWGQTGKSIKEGTIWTQQHADDALDIAAKECLQQTFNESSILRQESPEKQAAIADFVYNLGIERYAGSTLKTYVDAKLWRQAANEIQKWNKARVNGKLVELPGLTTRRLKEAKLLYV
jgi:lysozyme